MFHDTKPANYTSDKAGAICFVEHQGKFLILKRSPQSPQGDLWTGAPGGKLEAGETPLDAAVRETREETGIALNSNNLRFLHTIYYRFPDMEYALHIFHTNLPKRPLVTLKEDEHTAYDWKTLEETLELPIMRGGKECIEFVLNKL